MDHNASNRRGHGNSRRLEATKRKIKGWNAFFAKVVGGVSHVEALVWAVLYCHATDGVVTRANSQLMKDLNVSDKTVRRAITALRRANLLQVVRQGGLHVGASTYRLFVDDMRGKRLARTEAEVPPAVPSEGVPDTAPTNP